MGCGSGRDLRWLRDRSYRAVDLERSPGLARLARENGRCPVLEADFTVFDFSSLSVDGILLVGAFVHVPHGALPALLTRCTAALEPGGLVLITLKEGEGQATDARGRTFSLWQDEALRAVFAGLGFRVLDFQRDESRLGTGEVWLGYVLHVRVGEPAAGRALGVPPGRDRVLELRYNGCTNLLLHRFLPTVQQRR